MFGATTHPDGFGLGVQDTERPRGLQAREQGLRSPKPGGSGAVGRTSTPGAGASLGDVHADDPAASGRPLRIVVAKPGLDGHDRGAKVVARALRDAGMEVVHTGLHQTPEQIVETVVQEDADAVGLSVLSGAHMTLFARLAELLREREVDDVVVFGGGIIPDADLPELAALGVAQVFTPGASTEEIVSWVREHVGAE